MLTGGDAVTSLVLTYPRRTGVATTVAASPAKIAFTMRSDPCANAVAVTGAVPWTGREELGEEGER